MTGWEMATAPSKDGGGGKVGAMEAMMGEGKEISHVIAGDRGGDISIDEHTECDKEVK